MKKLIRFIKKEFFHIFRDPRTMAMVFGIPIAQLLIFGFVIRSEVQDVKIGILDLSKDQLTQKLITKLSSTDYFVPQYYLESEQEIDELMRGGKVREVIVFGPDFEKKFYNEGKANVQLISDASDPNSGKLVVAYTRSILMSFLQQEMQPTKRPLAINIQTRMFYNEDLRSVNLFVPGIIALILMLISAMMTSISITREKELGTMEILLVSPLRPIQIIIGKVFPYLVLSFLDAIIILLMAYFVFKVPVVGSLILLLAETLLFILMALSLGILISNTSKTQMEAMFKSMVILMLPTILLSGLIFPIENMPKILQHISVIMPARWYIVIVRGIMLKGVGLEILWKETFIILGFTLVFIAMSVKKFKIRLS